MPINYKDYPSNWKTEIRPKILIRAGGSMPDPRIGAKCEWCGCENHKQHPETGSKVVLTISHLNHEITDNRDENLAALCQKCHNKYDAKERAKKRKRNKLTNEQ